MSTLILTPNNHSEPHIKESNYIRDVVFGFGDGVNTTLGIVAGIGGATIGVDIVILAAIIGMFTGAKAMAVQNYLAVKSQIEVLESEIKREEYEIENKPEDERKEIEQIYKQKGFSGKELDMVVDRITSDKNVWLQTMLTEELGLNVGILGHPIKGALVMFVSFIIGGILPIIPYFVVKTGLFGNFTALLVAISISLTASFIVGAVKGKLAQKSWIKGGLEMSLLGTGIALLGYGIGSEMDNLGVVNFD